MPTKQQVKLVLVFSFFHLVTNQILYEDTNQEFKYACFQHYFNAHPNFQNEY